MTMQQNAQTTVGFWSSHGQTGTNQIKELRRLSACIRRELVVRLGYAAANTTLTVHDPSG